MYNLIVFSILGFIIVTVITIVQVFIYRFVTLRSTQQLVEGKTAQVVNHSVIVVFGETGVDEVGEFLEQMVLKSDTSKLVKTIEFSGSLLGLLQEYGRSCANNQTIIIRIPLEKLNTANSSQVNGLMKFIRTIDVTIVCLPGLNNHQSMIHSEIVLDLIDNLPRQSAVIVNWDDSVLNSISYPSRVKLFRISCEKKHVEWQITNIKYNLLKHTDFDVEFGTKSYHISTGVVTQDSLIRLIMAGAAVHVLGIRITTITPLLTTIEPATNSIRLYQVDKSIIVDNSVSVSNAFKRNTYTYAYHLRGDTIITMEISNLTRNIDKKELELLIKSIVELKPKLIVLVRSTSGFSANHSGGNRSAMSYFSKQLIEFGVDRYSILYEPKNTFSSIQTRLKREIQNNDNPLVIFDGPASVILLDALLKAE